MAGNSGFSGDHRSLFGLRDRRRPLRSWFHYTDHRHLDRVTDVVKSESGRSIAGDHKHLNPVLFKEMRSRDGVLGDGADSLGTVRQVCRVTEVEVAGAGKHRT